MERTAASPWSTARTFVYTLETAGSSESDLRLDPRSPQSRGAGGVGGVAGERGDARAFYEASIPPGRHPPSLLPRRGDPLCSRDRQYRVLPRPRWLRRWREDSFDVLEDGRLLLDEVITRRSRRDGASPIDSSDGRGNVTAGSQSTSKAGPSTSCVVGRSSTSGATSARRGPQSRGPGGVGDVAGERGRRPPPLRGVQSAGRLGRSGTLDAGWGLATLRSSAVAQLEGAVFRGPEGMAEFVAVQSETWESVHAEPVKMRDLGDAVLVEVYLSAVGEGAASRSM